MKKNAIFAFILAGALGFTSCTKKVDEKTMAEINQFGTDWTAMGEKANTWSTELSQMATQAKDFAAKQTEMVNTMTNVKDPAMKQKMTDMATMASNDATKLDGMMNEWNTFKTTYDETTKQYMDWKDKVVKGEVTPDDAVKGLADFKTKMADAQTKMDGWNTMYAETKSSCEKNMAEADQMSKMMTTTNKK